MKKFPEKFNAKKNPQLKAIKKLREKFKGRIVSDGMTGTIGRYR